MKIATLARFGMWAAIGFGTFVPSSSGVSSVLEHGSAATGTTLRSSAVFSTAQQTSQSFLRFYNTDSVAGTVKLTLANDASGATLAQWTSPSIPAGASRQFSIDDIERGTGVTFTKPANYSVSIQPQFSGGYFQHVLWRPADGTLTNLSTCDAGVTANPAQLPNVHSSNLDFGYPSTVVVVNAGATASAATLGIYDSTGGAKLGTYTTAAVPPNGQIRLAIAAIESSAKISPGAIYQYNVKFEGSYSGF